MNKITITTLIFILSTTLATAQVYKWRDENGKLVFSDSPPVSGPIAVQLQGSVKMIEVESPSVRESKKMAVDSDGLYRSNAEKGLITSNDYVYNEVQNAKEYLNLLLAKSTLNVQDIMMTDYIQFVFDQPESKTYLDYGDSISAKSLGQRGDTAKRSLSAKEKDNIDLGMEMMVGRWESETYQGLDKSEIKELDVILQRLWTQMNSAMADGNIEETLRCFHSSTQRAYRKQLEDFSLKQRENIVNDLKRPIHFVADNAGVVEYVMYLDREGKTYLQTILFQSEQDGMWKIRSF